MKKIVIFLFLICPCNSGQLNIITGFVTNNRFDDYSVSMHAINEEGRVSSSGELIPANEGLGWIALS